MSVVLHNVNVRLVENIHCNCMKEHICMGKIITFGNMVSLDGKENVLCLKKKLFFFESYLVLSYICTNTNTLISLLFSASKIGQGADQIEIPSTVGFSESGSVTMKDKGLSVKRSKKNNQRLVVSQKKRRQKGKKNGKTKKRK